MKNHKIKGISENTLIGENGSRIKADADKVQFRNKQDSDFVRIQAKTPLNDNDVANKKFVEDEIANVQYQIDNEKARIDAILDASDADKDSFVEIVQLINSVDTENDQGGFKLFSITNTETEPTQISNTANNEALPDFSDSLNTVEGVYYFRGYNEFGGRNLYRVTT